ncbi:hypothetical protein R3P38DRAFT_3429453 [Favolaschia claudopus]|uniref:Calcium-channel protein CCH1 n=1 Tax=Favolaschia claudopus TaxID=2862362 RepID=A0AAV9ZVB5_9AGAR
MRSIAQDDSQEDIAPARELPLLAAVRNEGATTHEELNNVFYERRAQKADFIRDHPSYDKTFWIFSQKNPLRKFYQKLVQPAGGQRLFGTTRSPTRYPLFQMLLLSVVIAGIVVESVADPVYRRQYVQDHGLSQYAWYDICESAFGLVFFAEFVVKIIADGFLFTSNAYVKSTWNLLDMVIMIGLLFNVTTGLIFAGGLSRFTRSFKALRALRLITLIDRMRTMNVCNDGTVGGAMTCLNDFTTSVYGDSFGFVVPRVWDNPAPSTIVSLEGWIDVMNIATSITGDNSQPETNTAQIFARIIIGNFSSRTGSAFLTAAQREWIDLQKLFKRQRPSKRPRSRPLWSVRAWCYDRVVNKNGWWHRGMSVVFVVHIIALMTQTFSAQHVVDELRNDFVLISASIYVLDVVVRLFGLGWLSFKANSWNVFDLIVAGGSFIISLIVRLGSFGFVTQQLQKLFLVCIAFKLVERTNSLNSLNKLFKTAVASLPIIANLIRLWAILFIFFGVLSLNQNFSSLERALVMLTFFTSGEGWNQCMTSTATVYPRCTNPEQEENSDCGSIGWAFTLFIAWNLLSMYIFVNLFTGVVVENFSYVFQVSGGSKSITRAQTRSFKTVWAEFANPKTGLLQRSSFVPFFGKLSGVFEARIYATEFSIPQHPSQISKPSGDSQYTKPRRIVDGVDLNKLEKVLKEIYYPVIRKRRAIYTRLYHEASSISHQGRGISFTDMLFLLAHHKLIVDRNALVLKDLVVRTETNKLVTDLVNLDRVRSLLKNDLTSTTRDIASASYGSAPSSPTPGRCFLPNVSLSSGTPRLQRSHKHRSDNSSMLSSDIVRSRESSISIDDPQQILHAMEPSIWGGKCLPNVHHEQY